MERGLVLVVEDEPAIAELVALYLRRDGFGVHLESSGDAALAAVRSLSPVAVVLDVGLARSTCTELSCGRSSVL